MTTPKVQYSYADGSANTIRPTRTTYPDGRELYLDYGSAGGMDDMLSRVGALVDDDGVIVLSEYSYLGLGTPVITDYTQPDVMYTLVGTAGGNDPDTGDIYRGLDRFGRVKDAYWRDYGASADAARIQYGYDRAGNRTYRADPVAVANGAPYEELYGYDAIHRLKTMDRGTLNGTKTALTTKSFDQCWTLDPTGNWKGFRQDDTGDGSWDLVQARTASPVNEITGITNSVGSTWATPAYNAAGNMTTIPQPADPTQSYTATYDAWNRLVKLTDGANTVAEYQYDARNYRTVQKTYTAGTLTETRHFYYSSNWQVLEERVGTSPDSAPAERQFVWGLRYIDDCVLRDRDTDDNGTLDERLYGLQDGNWNVIALTDTAGDVQERYAYQAYGTPKFLTAAFGNHSSSSYRWETLYCGYKYDTATATSNARYRFYNAISGAWCQRDPLVYVDGFSQYQYTKSNPLNQRDPYGTMCWSDIVAAEFALAYFARCASAIGGATSLANRLSDALGDLATYFGINYFNRGRSWIFYKNKHVRAAFEDMLRPGCQELVCNGKAASYETDMEYPQDESCILRDMVLNIGVLSYTGTISKSQPKCRCCYSGTFRYTDEIDAHDYFELVKTNRFDRQNPLIDKILAIVELGFDTVCDKLVGASINVDLRITTSGCF